MCPAGRHLVGRVKRKEGEGLTEVNKPRRRKRLIRVFGRRVETQMSVAEWLGSVKEHDINKDGRRVSSSEGG